MDPSKQTQSSTSGTCGSSSSSSVRHAFSEPDVVPRTTDWVTRRPRQGQRIHQFARGSHTPVPTTNQAVVLDWVPDIQLDSYIATVGNIVRPAHVRYASLVQPNRVCLFVSDAQMAQTLHGRTVVVEGHTLLVQPLIQPLARVLATNVYPFIEDQTIRDHLSVQHGVQVRDVVHVGADSQLPEYGHVLGFARHLYVPPEQLPMIPARITGRQVDWPYLIYLGSEEQRCTSCQHVGHLARYCAMDQRCIGAYAGSTTDRRSSISSGSLIPSDEGPPPYTSAGATDASVASASVQTQPRGVPSSLGPSPGQTVLKSEPSTATNANVTSSPKRTMPIGDQSSHERTPGKKKKNSSPLAETLAVSSPKTPKVQDSPKRSKERKDDLSSLERTPSKKNQISQSSLTKALEMMLDSPNAYFYPKGVILPSLMSSHTTNPQSKQVKNTINPSPLADDPSAPQPGTSTDHSSCPFVAATVGSPASQSNIGADPSADPSPSTPSNAAAAAANPSTSEGTPKKSIVKLDTIDTSLVRCPPSSGTRSLTRAAARCSPSGDAQPQSAESRPRPATPGIRRVIGCPRSIIHFDRRTSPAASRWTYRDQGEQEEEDELPLTSIEQQSTSDTE